jgi:hypothetical protein
MTGAPTDGDRAARLAAALRENLRRRKAQAQARAARDAADARRGPARAAPPRKARPREDAG